MRGKQRDGRPANFSMTRAGAGAPFEDKRIETYAQLRAAGESMRNASQEAFISIGSAQRLEHNDHVRERIGELRETERQFTTIKLGAIWHKLWENALAAAKAADYKASNQALGLLLAAMRGKNDPKASTMVGAVGAPGNAPALRAATPDSYRSLLGATPLVIEEPELTETGELDTEGASPTH